MANDRANVNMPDKGRLFEQMAPKRNAKLAVNAGVRGRMGNAMFPTVVEVKQVKSRINLRDTWSKRQARAMRPVRRAAWVWAAPAAKSCAR